MTTETNSIYISSFFTTSSLKLFEHSNLKCPITVLKETILQDEEAAITQTVKVENISYAERFHITQNTIFSELEIKDQIILKYVNND